MRTTLTVRDCLGLVIGLNLACVLSHIVFTLSFLRVCVCVCVCVGGGGGGEDVTSV